MGRSQRLRPKHLAKKLRAIREWLDLTQAQMVEELTRSGLKNERIYAATISQFEADKREPSLLVLLAYSKLSGHSINDLVDDHVKIS